LYSPEERSNRLYRAYWTVLGEVARFRSDLNSVYEGLYDELLLIEREAFAPIPEEVLRDFLRRWRLPTDHGSVWDLWSMLTHRRAIDEGKGVAFTSIQLVFKTEIVPPTPAPFTYDPVEMPRHELIAHAERAAAEVKAGILAQAEQHDAKLRARGWSEIPPRHRDHDELLRGARRLYRAAVLEMTWEAIADAEAQETAEAPDARSVKSTVTGWARTLGIELPRRRPGRPRKTD
jgi:hypothetical protein